MLVVTTTVRMLHWILRYTTNLGPAVTLDRILVVRTTRLEQGLVRSSATSYDTNLCTNFVRYNLLPTRRQTKTRRSLVKIMDHDDRKSSRSTGHHSTVSHLRLDITHNRTLRHFTQGHNIPQRQFSLLSTMNILARVHAFRTHQQLIVALVAVGVAELHFGEGSSTARVVNDFLDDATNVAVLLGVVETTEFRGSLAGAVVRFENGGFPLTLGLQKGG